MYRDDCNKSIEGKKKSNTGRDVRPVRPVNTPDGSELKELEERAQ